MNSHEAFLLKDFEMNSLLLGTYVSMRLAAMAGLLPLLGFFISQTSGPQPVIVKTGVLLLMILFASSTIRIVAAITRNIYARCLHLAWIETELKEFSFYSYWLAYAKKRSKDTSGHAFVIACRMINIAVVGYACEELTRTYLLVGVELAGVAVAGCAIVGFANEVYIRRNLCETGFLRHMEQDLEKFRLNAVPASLRHMPY